MSQIFKAIEMAESKAAAYDNINSRGGDAHDYCQTYLMPDAWGSNVWHSILDDAIRLRLELKKARENECRHTFPPNDMGQ